MTISAIYLTSRNVYSILRKIRINLHLFTLTHTHKKKIQFYCLVNANEFNPSRQVNIQVPAPEQQSDKIAITGLANHLERAKEGLLERVKELQVEQEDRVGVVTLWEHFAARLKRARNVVNSLLPHAGTQELQTDHHCGPQISPQDHRSQGRHYYQHPH